MCSLSADRLVLLHRCRVVRGVAGCSCARATPKHARASTHLARQRLWLCRRVHRPRLGLPYNKQMAEGAEVPAHFGPSPARGLPKRHAPISPRQDLATLLSHALAGVKCPAARPFQPLARPWSTQATRVETPRRACRDAPVAYGVVYPACNDARTQFAHGVAAAGRPATLWAN